jgi:glycosyltransferase involved in cell wall biosynthesis
MMRPSAVFSISFPVTGKYHSANEKRWLLMRILHFISVFSLLSETFVYDEINALEGVFPRGNTILTFERQLEKERPFPRVIVLTRKPSLAQKLQRRRLKLFERTNVPLEHLPLFCYLEQNLAAFDLIHVHFGWNALPIHQVFKRLSPEKRRPLVIQCQGTDVNSAPELIPEYRRQFLELAQDDGVRFTANSEFMKAKMVKLGIVPDKIHLVYNAYNRAFLSQRKEHFFKTGDELKLINTARFIEWKGQAYLVRGFARFVREVYGNSRLTLVGEGETLAKVKALAKNEGVADRIQFLGGVPHGEIPRLLSGHDLYVQSSIVDPKTFQEEGMPLAVLEAMAVGLPMVVTRTGGMPEIVGEANPFARIIPDRDPEAICRAFKELLEAGACSRDISAHAQKRLEIFSQERQVRDLKLVYAGALNRA